VRDEGGPPHAVDPRSSAGARAAQSLGWLRAAAWALPTGALAVGAHELGHYLASVGAGLAAPRLHYSSVDSAGETALWVLLSHGDTAALAAHHGRAVLATVAGAGILVSYATVAACLAWAWRRPHPFVVSLGLAGGVRLLSALVLLLFLAAGRPVSPETDEAHVAVALHLPLWVTCGLSATVLVAGTVALCRAVPRFGRWRVLAGIVAGVGLGLAAYMQVLGPRVLP